MWEHDGGLTGSALKYKRATLDVRPRRAPVPLLTPLHFILSPTRQRGEDVTTQIHNLKREVHEHTMAYTTIQKEQDRARVRELWSKPI
jgi:hypothetical protein